MERMTPISRTAACAAVAACLMALVGPRSDAIGKLAKWYGGEIQEYMDEFMDDGLLAIFPSPDREDRLCAACASVPDAAGRVSSALDREQ